MLKNLFKRTLLNKATTITFSIFLFIDIVIIALIMNKAYGWGAGSDSFSKAYYLAFFWLVVIELLIICILIRGVLFDSDINYLINVEKQYNVKIWKIYFYRILVKIAYCFAFVSVLLIFYFIFYSAIFGSNILASVFLSSSIGYIVYLYLFSFLSIGLSSITIYVKNVTFKYAIPFLLGFFFLGVTMSSTIFLFMTESSGSEMINEKHYQMFLGYEKEFENYYNFSSQISKDKNLTKYLIGSNPIIKNTDYYILGKEKDTKDEVKKTLHQVFLNKDEFNKIKLNKSVNSNNYNFILSKNSNFDTPGKIEYSDKKTTISNVFEALANSKIDELKTFNNDNFFKGLSTLYKDFEKDNIFSLYINGYFRTNETDLFLEEDFNKSYSSIQPLEQVIDYYIDKAQVYGLNQISDSVATFYTNNYDYFSEYLRKTAYFNPYYQIYFMTMNKCSNYLDDLNRASYTGGGAPMTKLKHFTFTETDTTISKNGDDITMYTIDSDTKTVTLYHYEVTVIEYIVLLLGLNVISYFIFAGKNKR